MFHEKFAELSSLGDLEIDGFIQRFAGEIDGSDEILGAGGHIEIFILTIHGQEMKLPGLSAVEGSETFGVDFLLLEIDDAGDANVLFDPGVLDGARVDAKEPLGEIAEGAVGHLLHAQDLLNLVGRQDALFDE
jgi:hypothetical protein